jgi:hypothetical protein
VPAYTFAACVTSIIFAGSVPVLTEVDESLPLDTDSAAGEKMLGQVVQEVAREAKKTLLGKQ